MTKKYSDQDILELLQRIDAGKPLSKEAQKALAERTELNFWYEDITALPESLGQLTNLQTLNLWHTPITALPESVRRLTNLQTLDLSFTRITALPESLGQLAKLQALDLTGTPITALPESLGQLAKLQTLDLRATPITALPESLGQLANLQALYLGDTQIAALPESLGQLANLQALSLSGTQIAALPESLGQLANLQALYLVSTRITALPESLGRLANLQWLYLSGTPITALPEWIGELPALQYLDLKGLTLPSIPESLALRGLPFAEEPDYRKLGIVLKGVTLTEQDKSIFLEHPELIPTLYQKEDLVPVRECRVIFLGDGASGKSYTIQRFRSEGKKETKKDSYLTSETPGVEILDYHVDRGEEPFDIHFWDFGGQQLLHSMHRCFLTDDTCYVVTVKTRETKANERARFWLRNVTAFAPHSPILLFVNCWEDDDGKRSIDEPGLCSEFPMIQRVVYCSAKRAEDGAFRKNVMDPVIALAAGSKGVCKKVPGQWVRVRRAIEAESAANNYLDKTRYHELCAENKIENEQAPELLSFFNELGVCFSYHRDAEKKELAAYKLLRPVWLTNAIYAVIEEGRVHAREGRIRREEIREMLCNPARSTVDGKPYRRTVPELVYKEEECPFILDVAIAHDLCYPVDESTLFFPALCDTDSPREALSAPEGCGQHVSYLLRYSYLPDSVLHQLMIRCMRNRLSVEKCWLRGMILYVWKLHQVFVRMTDDETLRIDLWSTGEHKAHALFWTLRRLIGEINEKLNLKAKEFILDGDNQFPLGSVLGAARGNSEVYDENGEPHNARKLLGEFYEKSFTQTMEIKNGSIVIPIRQREYHRWAQSDPVLRRALYEAYNGICPYCGNPLDYSDMQVDHILATKHRALPALESYFRFLTSCGFDIEKPDYIENYFPAHPHCNRKKSNRIDEYNLPYWHDIAAQHTPRVLEQIEKQK